MGYKNINDNIIQIKLNKALVGFSNSDTNWTWNGFGTEYKAVGNKT